LRTRRLDLRGGMSPHAVTDVGSNASHLLVGEVENDVVLPVAREKISVRLGSGAEKTEGIEEARIPVAVKATKLFCAPLPVVKNCSLQNIRGERWALIVRR
jgi:hypothetical protein